MTQNRITMSGNWSDALGEAIKARAPKSYPVFIPMARSEDFEAIKTAVNIGIDSHLEAVNFTQSGPSFEFDGETLHVLVRRLIQAWDSDDEGDAAYNLASGICETLGIELI